MAITIEIHSQANRERTLAVVASLPRTLLERVWRAVQAFFFSLIEPFYKASWDDFRITINKLKKEQEELKELESFKKESLNQYNCLLKKTKEIQFLFFSIKIHFYKQHSSEQINRFLQECMDLINDFDQMISSISYMTSIHQKNSCFLNLAKKARDKYDRFTKSYLECDFKLDGLSVKFEKLIQPLQEIDPKIQETGSLNKK